MNNTTLRSEIIRLRKALAASPHDPNCPTMHWRYSGKCHCPWKLPLASEFTQVDFASHEDQMEGYLRAVLEHIAPMLKLYEPNLPEHPVIAAIRDYLEKP